MANNYNGESFLNKIYKELYNSPEVLQGYKNPSQKEKNIQEYMDRLEILHKRVLDSSRENDLNMLKNFYYKKYVIKESDIPESYYKHQASIALERGYGHINITPMMKKEMAKQIIEEQKKSLDYWLEYFLSEDSKMYPTWAKYWAFQGMLKLGSFDKSSYEFSKRTKGTTSPFIELNHEALALSIDTLLKYINKENIEDNELKKLIEKGVFGKIYAYEITLLDKIKKEKSNTNNGEWIKYPQGSDYMELVNAIQGKGTGWCTAGASTAKDQLEMGDFYVYYSYDSEGKPTIPRIAIRMEGNNIGEVRGVAERQNLESDMESIVDKKLQEFSDYPKYQQKVSDMKKLTKIYKEYKTRELTIEELRFLYEIDREIVGFGYMKDPRIKEVLIDRNIKKDLSLIFECSEKEIGTSDDDLYNENLAAYYGGLDDSDFEIIGNKKAPKILIGNLELYGNYDWKNIIFPEVVYGNIMFNHTNLSNLVFPKKVKGSVSLSNLVEANKIVLPEEIYGNLYLNLLARANEVIFPKYVEEDIILDSLKNGKGIKFQEEITGNLDFGNLEVLDFKLPKILNGTLFIDNLKSSNNLVLPEIVNGSIYIRGLKIFKNVILPKNVTGKIDLDDVESLQDLIFPEEMSGELFFHEAKTISNVIFPKKLNGYLNLNSLKYGDNIVLPEFVNGALYLSSMEDSNNIIFPKEVFGNVYLNSLILDKVLNLPKKIRGILYVSGLTCLDELILPSNLDCQCIVIGSRDKIKIHPEEFYKYQKQSNKEENNRTR